MRMLFLVLLWAVAGLGLALYQQLHQGGESVMTTVGAVARAAVVTPIAALANLVNRTPPPPTSPAA